MTAPAAVRAPLTDRGRHVRVRALARLQAIAYDDPGRYDPATVIAHGHFVGVIVRDAMCATHLPATSGPPTTCGRCLAPCGGGHDDDLLDEVRALEPVAMGRVLAVMDVLGGGDLPAHAPDTPALMSADALADALEALP